MVKEKQRDCDNGSGICSRVTSANFGVFMMPLDCAHCNILNSIIYIIKELLPQMNVHIIRITIITINIINHSPSAVLASTRSQDIYLTKPEAKHPPIPPHPLPHTQSPY